MTHAPDADDPFVDEALEEGASLDEFAALLAGTLSPAPIAPSHRLRVLESATHKGRFQRFAEPVAKLLDLSISDARKLLDQLHDESVWTSDVPPPALAFWVRGGPRVEGCVRGFVRIPHGARFPDHEHLGDERGFVLQGAFIDPASGERFRAGDSFSMPAGSIHQPYVPSDGLDLLFLVVVEGGYRVGEHLLLPRD